MSMNTTKTCTCEKPHAQYVTSHGQILSSHCVVCHLPLPTKVDKCCSKFGHYIGMSNPPSLVCTNLDCECHPKPEEIKVGLDYGYDKDSTHFRLSPKPEQQSSWKKEFALRLAAGYFDDPFSKNADGTSILKFIETLLAQAKAESYKEGVNAENSRLVKEAKDRMEHYASESRKDLNAGNVMLAYDMDSRFVAMKHFAAAIAPEVSRDEQ